jgi:hypothetical protein
MSSCLQVKEKPGKHFQQSILYSYPAPMLMFIIRLLFILLSIAFCCSQVKGQIKQTIELRGEVFDSLSWQKRKSLK